MFLPIIIRVVNRHRGKNDKKWTAIRNAVHFRSIELSDTPDCFIAMHTLITATAA